MVFILTFEKDSHFWNRWNIYLFGCSRCQPRFIDQKAGFESCLYLVIHSILRNSSPKLPNIHWCINISQRYNFNISVIEILSILQRHNIDILLKYYQYCKDIILIYYWNTIKLLEKYRFGARGCSDWGKLEVDVDEGFAEEISFWKVLWWKYGNRSFDITNRLIFKKTGKSAS